MNKLKHNASIISDLAIHSLLLFIFASIIFILYLTKISDKILKNKVADAMENKVKDIIYTNKKLLIKNYDSKIYDKLKKKYSKEDEYKLLNNSWLKKSLLITNLLLLIIVVGGIYLLKNICNIDININKLVMINIFAFVGLNIFEYLLYIHIETKYMYTTSAILIDTIINNSIKYFSH